MRSFIPFQTLPVLVVSDFKMTDKNLEYRKCQMVFSSVLGHLGQKDSGTSIFDVYEIMDTEKCDEFHNLSAVRKATEKEINIGDPNRMQRILSRDLSNDKDPVFATATIKHYQKWYKFELENALDTQTWLRENVFVSAMYQTVFAGLTVSGITWFFGASPRTIYASGVGACMFYIVGRSFQLIIRPA